MTRDFAADLESIESGGNFRLLSKGPWRVVSVACHDSDGDFCGNDYYIQDVNGDDIGGMNEEDDAQFTAAARDGWPAALHALLATREENQRLTAAVAEHHRQYDELRAAVWDSSSNPIGPAGWHDLDHAETLDHARTQVATLQRLAVQNDQYSDVAGALEGGIARVAESDAAAARARHLLGHLADLILRDGGRDRARLGEGDALACNAADALELQRERLGRLEADFHAMTADRARMAAERARLVVWLAEAIRYTECIPLKDSPDWIIDARKFLSNKG